MNGIPAPPASRGRNRVQAHLEEPTSSDEEVGGWPEESAVRVAPEPAADAAPGVDDIAEPATEAPDAAATARGEATDDSAEGSNGSADGDGGRAAASRRSSPTRKGRPSVPSWDDIVFGTRGGTSP